MWGIILIALEQWGIAKFFSGLFSLFKPSRDKEIASAKKVDDKVITMSDDDIARGLSKFTRD